MEKENKNEKDDKSKKKKLKNLTRGFVSLLPIVIFILILKWVYGLIVSSVSWISTIISSQINYTLPTFVLDLLSCLLIVFFIWLVGVIMNEKHLGHRLEKKLRPKLAKVPLLSALIKIVNQIVSTLRNTNSFRETVLLKPSKKDDIYFVGFITSENVEQIEEMTKKNGLVSVFVPTAPNPTNGFLAVVNKDILLKTDIPVPTAVSFVVSMGTTGLTQQREESSQDPE